MMFMLKSTAWLATLQSSTRSFGSLRPALYAAISSSTAPALETNVKSETNRLEKTLTKFWEKVDVTEDSEGIHVQLDGKTLKTPLGNRLILPPTKAPLAHLIAHEWKNLQTLTIKPYTVPLTSVAARAVDLKYVEETKDPEVAAKMGTADDVKESLLRYLDTDTLLVFSPHHEYQGKLRSAQEEIYRPIIKSMEDYFARHAGVEKLVFSYLDTEKDGLRGNMQTEETKDAVRKWLKNLSVWELVALEKATLTVKSFLAGTAILRANHPAETERLSIHDVAKAADLETIFQTERWGEVEDTHDVDKVDIVRNLATAALVCHDH
ncbi:unnamed protein product [Kuraishia capsulata CBS 1993]|uniref:Uncharacterized protein n=1 Tax=Kuraishia capsulata CBS 1993 TaxID=1382522 RepID=W6MGF4_9ASCO|nr:uncharacterized protein KUCA_T00001136001 [Kuraishia capsulata CBS 1993]CDK25169.1 unnamed protein product [Kuraishia capsulata CBS 1993]